jgi:hypothetical protein
MFRREYLYRTRRYWRYTTLLVTLGHVSTTNVQFNLEYIKVERQQCGQHTWQETVNKTRHYVTVTQFRIPIIDLPVKKNGKIVQVSFLLLRWRGKKVQIFWWALEWSAEEKKKFQQGPRVIINLLRQPLYNLFGNIVGRGERLKCVDLQMVGGSVVVALCVDNTSNIYIFFSPWGQFYYYDFF